MRHSIPYRKLSRQRSHYRALMRNMALALFEHERIETTIAKAKEARRFVDQIITLAKSGTLHDRRRAMSLMGNKITHKPNGERVDLIGQKVFGDLAKRYKSRPGGYTRIIKLARARPGDAASMVIFELVDRVEKPVKAKGGEDSATEAAAAAPAKKAKEPKAKTSKKTAPKKKAAKEAESE